VKIESLTQVEAAGAIGNRSSKQQKQQQLSLGNNKSALTEAHALEPGGSTAAAGFFL
jgi:hypothetical protein